MEHNQTEGTMNKDKLFTKKRLQTLLSKNDNSSVRVTVKVSEQSLKTINDYLSPKPDSITDPFSAPYPNFKIFFNNVLSEAIDTQDFSLKTLTICKHTIKSNLISDITKQKTFVISKTANIVLDDFASFCGMPKNKTFNLMINGYTHATLLNIFKNSQENLVIYQKINKIMTQLDKDFYKSYDQIAELLSEQHTPSLEIEAYIPEDNPLENFMGNLAYSEIHLSSCLSPLQETINDCTKMADKKSFIKLLGLDLKEEKS